MRMHYIGIDPGKSGAVAVIPIIDGKIGDVSVTDIPVLKADKGTKASYDPAAMARLLLNATDEADELHVFIEQVHSMPGQGVASMFDFGKGYGIWLGILAAVQMPYTIVTPQRWKKAMLSDMKQDKSASRGREPALSCYLRSLREDQGRWSRGSSADRRVRSPAGDCVNEIDEICSREDVCTMLDETPNANPELIQTDQGLIPKPGARARGGNVYSKQRHLVKEAEESGVSSSPGRFAPHSH